MEKESIFRSRKVKIAALILVIALFLGFAFFIITQIRSQREKLAELRQEIARLEEKRSELMREQERLESNLEYVKSNEGLLRYARENLGYIGEDEIRIDVSD